ncbi:MAG: hypothetical protein JSR41_09945 [Proteobacteria bacterium]|nr:hypothetical protein [Pseudomonadota bacterium]
MARLDWIVARLNNWARWRASMAGSGLGYSSQAAFLNDLPGADREVKLPIDDIEGSITDEAVKSLEHSRPHLYAVLWCMYPFGLGVSGTCKRLGCDRSNVYSLLDVADRQLAAWFTDRADRQRAAAAEKRSFTS